MNSVLGQSLIVLALVAAAFGATAGWVTGNRPSPRALLMLRGATYVFGSALIFANVIMVLALVGHDFSVKYVSQVGSRSTPLYITIVSLWSALEGSILFWGLILGVFAIIFARSLKDKFATHAPYALATVLSVGLFFAFLLAGPSDPFAAVSPVPPDGPGPNPLLQNHLLMIVHPPMLYFGYVGMILPFAVAVAALMRGELSDGWLKVLRRTTLIAWGFLTVGIIMGAWWAYEVLGWGGYWAWDPVENASFLPWLAATAYLHSTIVHERRRMLKAWTLSLVIGAFLLTILGTFMTRSGVFNSVHSFTQSMIGPLFLVFLTVLIIFSIMLLVGRAHLLVAENRIEAIISRETAFLLNNVVLTIFTFTVLLGTVFPLLAEAVRGVKLSVGEPYFNRMAVPLGMLLVVLMGVGPLLPWGKPNLRIVWRAFVAPLALGVLVTIGLAAAGMRDWRPLVTFGACGFAAGTSLREMLLPFVLRWGEDVGALLAVASAQRRRLGAHLVHLGIVVVVAGVCGSSFKHTADLSLAPNETATLAGYSIRLQGVSERNEAHRQVVVATLVIDRDGKHVADATPSLNYYRTQREPVGSPSVQTSGLNDLYFSLMSFEPDGSRVAIKAFVVPLVSWLWWSLPVFVLGTLVALWPRRRIAGVRLGAARTEGVVLS